MRILKNGKFPEETIRSIQKEVAINKKKDTAAKRELRVRRLGKKGYTICDHCNCEYNFTARDVKLLDRIFPERAGMPYVRCPRCNSINS
jgi:hypothetical protein